MLLNDDTNKHLECCFDLCNFDREVPEWCSSMSSHKIVFHWASDQEPENLMVQWATNLPNYTITELMFLLLYLRIWHDNSLKQDVLSLWHPLTCTVIHKKKKKKKKWGELEKNNVLINFLPNFASCLLRTHLFIRWQLCVGNNTKQEIENNSTLKSIPIFSREDKKMKMTTA